jgi:hypothetical protein
VTFSSLPAGTYDLWLRYQPDAASYHRIRAEWAPVASPSIYNALEDFLCDVRTATAFAYADHLFGRLEVPADFTTPTVTVRVSSGIETGTAQNLRLDCVYLKKADDHVGQVTSPTLLTTGEFLVSDAEADRAYHLDTSSQTKEVAESSGPMPIELQPGLNLIDPVLLKDAAGGFVDRASTLGAVHTIAVNHKPRYRT